LTSNRYTQCAVWISCDTSDESFIALYGASPSAEDEWTMGMGHNGQSNYWLLVSAPGSSVS